VPTANEDLRNRLISHQIGIRRFTTQELAEILRILNRGERGLRRELARRLASFGVVAGDVETPVGIIRLETMLDDLQAIRREYLRELQGVFAADLEELARYEQGFTAGLVRRSVPTPIPVDMLLASDALIRSIVRSDPFQGRILREHFERLSRKNGPAAVAMREAIEDGLLTGQPLLGIVRKVNRTALGLERRAVTAIVHSAIHHVTGSMRDEVARLNSDLIEAQQWLSTLDLKTTEMCIVRDGHTYDAVTHEPLDGGPPWDAGPGRLHWNCRSDSTYVMKSWEELGVNANELTGSMRASMNGHVPAETDYEEWLSGRSAAEVDRVFGKAKGAMWRNGVISADDLIGRGGLDPISLRRLWRDHADELLSAGFEPVGFPGAAAVREALA
jgi:hypothetical protein